MKKYDFKTDLARGAVGAQLFHEKYPSLKALDGRKADFETQSGVKVELKADFTPMLKTQNFFMERYSNLDKKKPGGPWASLVHEVALFAYLFVVDGVVYWFKTEELVKRLEERASEFVQRTIRNTGWASLGYLVPRKEVEDLIIRKEVINEDPLA